MNIVSIINNKILEKKTVGNNYQMSEFDFLDNGEYGEIGEILIEGVWQRDPQEIAEQDKQLRISELETLIEKKKLRGYDYSVELSELELLDPIL